MPLVSESMSSRPWTHHGTQPPSPFRQLGHTDGNFAAPISTLRVAYSMIPEGAFVHWIQYTHCDVCETIAVMPCVMDVGVPRLCRIKYFYSFMQGPYAAPYNIFQERNRLHLRGRTTTNQHSSHLSQTNVVIRAIEMNGEHRNR